MDSMMLRTSNQVLCNVWLYNFYDMRLATEFDKQDTVNDFSTFSKVSKVLFVPYALHNRDEYAATARKAFSAMGKVFFMCDTCVNT